MTDLTLTDLMSMDGRALHAVMQRAHPFDPAALADTQYLGVDLSMPRFFQHLLWQTFRKTFHRDPESGALRGWNVRMAQTGVDGPQTPLTDHRDWQRTFGHYEVRSAAGVPFPRGWRGAHFLDYNHAGNRFLDVARLGYTPLVAVNAGRSDLLLGWEIFRVAGLFLPFPLYWALKLDGPLEVIEPVPVPSRRRVGIASRV